MPPAREPSWYEKQYVLSALAICGIIATALTGVMVWWVREISNEVRKVPILEQRVAVLQEAKGLTEGTIARLQLSITAQDKTQALLEQRLGTIDASLREVSAQLRQLITRLPGGQNFPPVGP